MTKETKTLIVAGVAVAGVALYMKQQEFNNLADMVSVGDGPGDDSDTSGSNTSLIILGGAVLLGLLLVAYITREVIG